MYALNTNAQSTSAVPVRVPVLVDPLPGVETNSYLVNWLTGLLVNWLSGLLVDSLTA